MINLTGFEMTENFSKWIYSISELRHDEWWYLSDKISNELENEIDEMDNKDTRQ